MIYILSAVVLFRSVVLLFEVDEVAWELSEVPTLMSSFILEVELFDEMTSDVNSLVGSVFFDDNKKKQRTKKQSRWRGSVLIGREKPLSQQKQFHTLELLYSRTFTHYTPFYSSFLTFSSFLSSFFLPSFTRLSLPLSRPLRHTNINIPQFSSQFSNLVSLRLVELVKKV